MTTKNTAILFTIMLTIFFLSGCSDAPFSPVQKNQNNHFNGQFAPVEVTITGIGSDHLSANVRSMVGRPLLVAPATTPDTPPPTVSGANTLAQVTKFSSRDIKYISSGGFTYGQPGDGGQRYVFVMFKVRNPTNQVLHNLTFMAVQTSQTIGKTAVRSLMKFNGDKITGAKAEAIARKMVPTGMVHLNAAREIISTTPDVLQVFARDSIKHFDISGTAVTHMFPYGFVTRTPDVTPHSRTLPANGQYDGMVTFAFKVPLQAKPADNPFKISMMFLPITDDVTHITQSLEEQTKYASEALFERAKKLNAAYVTLLPGAVYSKYPASVRLHALCGQVRVAGSASQPTYLFPKPPELISMSPDPFDAGAHQISKTTSFSAVFSKNIEEVNSRRVAVYGSRSGARFLNSHYHGDGTSTISTPGPSDKFFPGERVEVTLTPGLVTCQPSVFRYRVAAGSGTGTFVKMNKQSLTGSQLTSVVAGDWDADGDLDLAALNTSSYEIKFINYSQGDNKFLPGSTIDINWPQLVITGDWNRDGYTDLAVVSYISSTKMNINIFMNDGSGSFQSPV